VNKMRHLFALSRRIT